jgi:hypothetical protein
VLVEHGAGLARNPDAIKLYLGGSKRFARCFIDYAAIDGLIHRSSDVVPTDFRSGSFGRTTRFSEIDREPPVKSRLSASSPSGAIREAVVAETPVIGKFAQMTNSGVQPD